MFQKKEYTENIFLPKFKEAIDDAFSKLNPDVIFIAAGFDARKGDPVARFEDGQGLDDSSYFKMSNYIRQKQKAYGNNSAIISLQEGGIILMGQVSHKR